MSSGDAGSRSLRIAMLGTGDFAVPTFRALLDSRHTVVGLVTQPERIGRGHHQHAESEIKRTAMDRGVPVHQPENVNLSDGLAMLRSLNAELFVVAAYGQILSDELLTIPPLGAINVHASVLPKFRGAAPINYAIWRGETETGVTIIQIQPRLDAGPILAVVKTPIGLRETAGELEVRLAELGPEPSLRVIDQLLTGTLSPIPQDSAQVTRAPKLKKLQGLIDWNQPATQIDCHVRALQPWPNAFTFIHSGTKQPQRVIILEVEPRSTTSTAAPGHVLASESGRLLVQTGTIPVEIVRLQPDGKRGMAAGEFLRGNPLRPGDWLGT
ncbi:MAG: methionyl-tRNA formyltransferase [Planctomycetales bacterium]|nr:methionyl-tRNA formyltransferase [Planctomycetales bacterium]